MALLYAEIPLVVRFAYRAIRTAPLHSRRAPKKLVVLTGALDQAGSEGPRNLVRLKELIVLLLYSGSSALSQLLCITTSDRPGALLIPQASPVFKIQTSDADRLIPAGRPERRFFDFEDGFAGFLTERSHFKQAY